MSRAYFSRLEQERIKEMNLKLQGKSLFQRLNILTEAMIEQHQRFKTREYHSHYTIICLDMTQADPYGIPKLILNGKGSTLAYPHKVRVVIKANFEGKDFITDIGGFDITQTTRSRW